jgi:hypothetical protein
MHEDTRISMFRFAMEDLKALDIHVAELLLVLYKEIPEPLEIGRAYHC